MASTAESDLPDLLAPGLACVFCGINPGRVSAAAHAHFANPRNDFWRLLQAAGFTPRQLDPSDGDALLALGYGITNAALRTTPGSGNLRRGDFDRPRIERVARELRPRALAFVGKEAYRGLFGERAELGPQLRSIETTGLFVLPSTSPANAAVPYVERLRSFAALRSWLEPSRRTAVRALVVDAADRVLLLRLENPATPDAWWVTPGGGVEPDESDDQTLRRELREEAGLVEPEIGALLWQRATTFPWNRRLFQQEERVHLVRVDAHTVVPEVDLAAEGVQEHRWWTLAELEATSERITPRELPEVLRAILRGAQPDAPLTLSG